jgi:hypothetical protein
VIEPSSRTLRANELAIPARASETPTERISESDRIQFALLAAATPAPAARWTPRTARGAVIGLVSTTLIFGILLTTSLKRPWRFRGTWLLSSHFMEKVPAPSPSPSPPPLPLVQPIMVAAAPVPFDAQPLHHGVSKSTRDGRVRGTHAIQDLRRAATAGSELPDSAPSAATASPAPAAKWVDPFAE